jgi:RHS repeat-associated protein
MVENPDYAEEALAHDAAGNLTYDGNYKFKYDAWNRLVEVRRAYRDDEDTLTEGSTIATMAYDGLGRRIKKAVTNSGDWDCTYHYYHDGSRMIETRNGSGQVLTQHLWGTQYVDELVQVAHNDDPADAGEHDCETAYYALQDANFNVLGLVDAGGDLAERYEYTPYGQRTAFTSPGSDDALCSSPVMESWRVEVSGAKQPYGLCDVGHQGLMHDKEFGLIYNRARYLHPILARLLQHDPMGYVDGTNLYEYIHSCPTGASDPSGLVMQVEDIGPFSAFDHWRDGTGETVKVIGTDFIKHVRQISYVALRHVGGTKSSDSCRSFRNR